MYQYKSESLPTNNIKMILITSFYENPQKYEEWMYCLNQNIKNKNIKKIIYFLEGFDFIKNELDFFNYFNIEITLKLKIIKIKSRPSFYTLIDYANQFNDPILITNADIYFENLNLFKDIKKSLFSLTRYSFDKDKKNYYLPSFDNSIYPAIPKNITDYSKLNFHECYHPKYKNKIIPCDNTKCFANEYSSDAWIFHAPLTIDDRYKNVFLGVFRCDNYMTKLWVDKIKEGYTFENPCLSIKAIHYDFSTSRFFEDDTNEMFDGVSVHKLFIPWSYFSSISQN